MTEDNLGCPVCGKHFADEEEFKNHGKDDHPEVQENFPDIFDKKEEEPAKEIEKQEDKPVQSHDDWQKDLDSMRDEYSKETADNCAVCGDLDHTTEEHWDKVPAWQKPNYGDEDHVPPMTPIPNEDVGDYKDDLQWDDKTNHYVHKSEEQEDELVIDNDEDLYALHKGIMDKPIEGEEQETVKLDDPPTIGWSDVYGQSPPVEDAKEEGGADDPLKKVADLAESYRYMSKDHRASLFESLDFTQGDSAILSGLEWNELTRPIKVEASEAYIKEQEEDIVEEPIKEDEEDKAYENLYNLEKYHSSPDFKKKSITCTRCNESFYNVNDRSIHFNEVHATEQEYELPEVCPYCNIVLPESEDVDWHMQEQHGAHVPSQFTQTGVQGAMADTDFDSLESYAKENDDLNAIFSDYELSGKQPYSEQGFQDFIETNYPYMLTPHESRSEFHKWIQGESHKKAGEARWECLDCDTEFDDAGKHQEETGHHNISKKAEEGELAGYPDEDEYSDPEFGSTRPIEQRGNEQDTPFLQDEDDEFINIYDEIKSEDEKEGEEGGAGSGPQSGSALLPEQSAMKNINPDYDPFKATPKSQLLQTDPYVTRTTEEAPDTNKSELETEIKDLENFINMASYENPLNMGEYQDRLDGLKSQLATEDDEEEEDDNEDYPEGWDKRKPEIGGYDPELDYDG